jgi:Short-chain dehydrogenases of various substrate specificities
LRAGRSAEKRAALDALAGERQLPLSTLEMDVTRDASVDRALGEMRAAAGPIDVLINNAGIGIMAAFEEVSLEDVRRQFEANVFSVVRVTQRVLPEMRARRRGRILNMSSVAGRITLPFYALYSGSKYALEAMSDALRLEVYPFGIDVVLIEPGYIKTSFQDTSYELSSSYWRDSANSPYQALYDTFRAIRRKNIERSGYAPDDCARVVLRAIRTRRPRARYGVTRTAWIVPLLRRVLTDGMIDRILISRFGLHKLRREMAGKA